jgi:hypothetical protein
VNPRAVDAIGDFRGIRHGPRCELVLAAVSISGCATTAEYSGADRAGLPQKFGGRAMTTSPRNASISGPVYFAQLQSPAADRSEEIATQEPLPQPPIPNTHSQRRRCRRHQDGQRPVRHLRQLQLRHDHGIPAHDRSDGFRGRILTFDPAMLKELNPFSSTLADLKVHST